MVACDQLPKRQVCTTTTTAGTIRQLVGSLAKTRIRASFWYSEPEPVPMSRIVQSPILIRRVRSVVHRGPNWRGDRCRCRLRLVRRHMGRRRTTRTSYA